VTDQKDKPVLDQQTFEKLLEAGYVLQEHNRKLRELEARMESHSERLREQESADHALRRKSRPESEETSRSDSDYTLTLAEIVEAQRQIQVRHLDLDKAMGVIAEKVTRIARAAGAGIGILEGKIVRYRGGAGAPALPLGSEVPLSTALCAASVRTGQVIRSEDVNTEMLFDPEPCLQRGILSLVAVPIYHDGDIVGALELYFDRIRGYAEQDIHTCQLMAGLVTEAIGRDAGSELEKTMAVAMMAAIEKLQPNLTASEEDRSATTVSAGADVAGIAKSPCWKCGTNLVTEEQFCGKCGAPRISDAEASSMQSKLASAWNRQHPGEEIFAGTPTNGSSPTWETMRAAAAHPQEYETDPFAPAEPLDHLSARPFSGSANGNSTEEPLSSETTVDEDDVARSTAITKPQPQDVVWTSAAKARDFLEAVSGSHAPGALTRFWRSRRGDFYLAVAVILVMVVIRWGIWSNHSVGATGTGGAVSTNANRRKQAAPEADLSAFDKFLIAMGLAEAPETPEYKGNPDTQVWIDLRTALYYCPGSELYGKTPKGRLSSQRDAQLDQFEPSNRKPCD
jgi:GAF domain-containing protein